MLYRICCLILSLFLLQICGSCGRQREIVRVGIDPVWYPIDFGPQATYVNGFTEELLLAISRDTGIEFERITANWDSLYDGMRVDRYDVVLSSLPLHDFNVAEYDFSSNFLDLGPVLVISANSATMDLDKMSGKSVGTVTGDSAVSILQKYPDVIARPIYPSVPELLNAVAEGRIEGALLDRIPAVNYLADLYAGRLKIATPPLNNAGLHLVARKEKQTRFVARFNRSIEQLKKKKKLQKLLAKWELGYDAIPSS